MAARKNENEGSEVSNDFSDNAQKQVEKLKKLIDQLPSGLAKDLLAASYKVITKLGDSEVSPELESKMQQPEERQQTQKTTPTTKSRYKISTGKPLTDAQETARQILEKTAEGFSNIKGITSEEVKLAQKLMTDPKCASLMFKVLAAAATKNIALQVKQNLSTDRSNSFPKKVQKDIFDRKTVTNQRTSKAVLSAEQKATELKKKGSRGR